MPATPAAAYVRSSKDRAEIGLDAQSAELKAFAKSKGYRIAHTYSDMEISGSLDEVSRPGLRQLLSDLDDQARAWRVILAVDPSRIARDPMVSAYVTRQAEKRNVRIEYAKMALDESSAYGEAMLNVVRTFDRLHARVSSEKGRAGQEVNFSKGFRAGGRAPTGYKLAHETTGGTRGGEAVQKSRLVLDKVAARPIAAFLKARAAGVPRTQAARAAALKAPVATQISYERNALTYAGYSVWNMRKKHRPTKDDPRRTMFWRPRSEWLVSEQPTHEAVITREEADRVVAYHEDRFTPQVRAPRIDGGLLSGLLFGPDGMQWHIDRVTDSYRHGKGKKVGGTGARINAPALEREVIERIARDCRDPKLATKIVNDARKAAATIEADPAALDGEIKKCERQIRNLVDVAADTGDKAIAARIRETEQRVAELRQQRSEWASRADLKAQLQAISEKDVLKALSISGAELVFPGVAADVEDLTDPKRPSLARVRLQPDELRRILAALVSRIVLDPTTRALEINYRLSWDLLASPRYARPRASARSTNFQTRDCRPVTGGSGYCSADTEAHPHALGYFLIATSNAS